MPARALARLLSTRKLSATEVMRAFNAREFRVLASQAVCDLFHEEESGALAMLGDFIGKPVSMQLESGYTQEQYDIVLL